MKIIKYISFFILIHFFTLPYYQALSSYKVEVVDGENTWEQQKGHYVRNVVGQFRERHLRYAKTDLFKEILGLERQNSLYQSVKFTLRDVEGGATGEGVGLDFRLSRGGAAQVQLFIAFNEAIVEIFDTTTDILNKAKYLRSDLKVVKNYFIQALVFLKSVANTSRYLFEGERNDFNERKFIKALDHVALPTPVAALMRVNEEKLQNIRIHGGGVFTLAQYLDFYGATYSTLLLNQYISIKAHLNSENKKTRAFLNRKLKGELENFKFDLASINLPDYRQPDLIHDGGKAFPTQVIEEGGSKKKRNRRRQRGHGGVPKAASSVLEEHTPSEPKLAPVGQEHVKPKEIPEPLAQEADLSEAPSKPIDQADPSVAVKGQEISGEDHPAALVEEEEQGSADALPSRIEDINNAPIFEEPNAPEAPQGEEVTPLQKLEQEISQIQRLNEILDEFDGGPHAGMKTRKFLRLCSALNDGGFFSEFALNKKEVHIKTANLVTVMHTNHSGNKKEAGITHRTAKMLQKVISDINTGSKEEKKG